MIVVTDQTEYSFTLLSDVDAIIAAVMHWLASAEKNVNYIESRDTIFEVP